MANKKDLKAYIRYDGTGRVIPGSLILNRFKPAVGDWKETPAYENCCTPTGDFIITESSQPLTTEDNVNLILE